MAFPVPSSSPIFRFGPFELNPAIFALTKSGISLKLQPQPFQVLVLLVERQGQVVTRADIQRHVWGDSTHVDFERGINFSVNQIRAVLCDDIAKPRYIQTLPRVGYRFIAPVIRDGDVPESPASANSSEPMLKLESRQPPETNSRPPDPTEGESQFRGIRSAVKPWLFNPRGLSLFVVCLLLVAALGYLAKSWWRNKKIQLPAQIVRVTSSPGFEVQPNFSPDGNQIAFSADESGNYEIYVKAIDDEKRLRLTQPPGSSFCPNWSPDGKVIAYERRIPTPRGPADRSLLLSSPFGGAKHLIGHPSASGGCGVSWSPDSKLLAFGDQPPGENAGIFVLSLDGAPVKRLTTSPAGVFDRSPAFSQDGRQIAFSRDKEAAGNSDIYLLVLATHEEKRLASLDRMVSSLTWTADGKRIIFAVGAIFTGDSKLFSVAANGGEAERLPIVSSEGADPVVSRQGNRLAYVTPVADANIWKYSIQDNTLPSKSISSTQVDTQPNFSPDGRRVAFVSNRDSEYVIWLSNADGSEAVRASAIKGGTPVWSPDGKQIAFDTSEHGHADIALVSADGGKPEFLTDDNDADVGPSWSADGNSLYFSSNRTGGWEIWNISVGNKNMTQVTRHGGYYGQESPDGRFVYFQKPSTKNIADWTITPEIWRMPSAGGQEELVVRISDPAALPHAWWFWRVTSRGIYFIDNSASPKALLRFVSLPGRKIRTLRQLEKPAWGGPGLAVSPDEKTILVGQMDEWGSDIMLVENFDSRQ